MPLLEKFLEIKRSKIPAAGKGLYTKKFIPKGTRIIQYKGNEITWKEAKAQEEFNGYIYYVNRNLVIDAKNYLKSLGRYANDAAGITKVKGITNNCKYEVEDLKVYVVSIKDIEAGSEIYVPYGKEYWDVIKHNKKHGFI